MGRQDAWAYGLVVLDLGTLGLWLRFLILDHPDRLTPFDPGGPLFLAPGVVFALLGCLGFWMLVRMHRNPGQWHRLSDLLLKQASVIVLLPPFFYAGLAYLLFTTDVFD